MRSLLFFAKLYSPRLSPKTCILQVKWCNLRPGFKIDNVAEVILANTLSNKTLSNFPKVVKATDLNSFCFTISVGFARKGSNPFIIAQFTFWSLCRTVASDIPISRDSPLVSRNYFFDLLFFLLFSI